MIPKANIEAFWKPPPEKVLINPANVFDCTALDNLLTSIPGTGICTPTLATRNIIRVNNTLFLSSGISIIDFTLFITASDKVKLPPHF